MSTPEEYDLDPRLTDLSFGGGVGHIVFDPDLPFVDSAIVSVRPIAFLT